MTKVIHNPYLIQRGTLRTRTVLTPDATGLPRGIDALIDYDYMGASEFEHGALHRSLVAILEDIDRVDIFLTSISNKVGDKLIVVCADEYQGVVTEIVTRLATRGDRDFHLHERTDMMEALAGTSNINFWWDIEHDWMAVLGLKNSKKLLAALKVSKARLDAFKDPERHEEQQGESPVLSPQKIRVSCCGRWTYWRVGQSPKICPKCSKDMQPESGITI